MSNQFRKRRVRNAELCSSGSEVLIAGYGIPLGGGARAIACGERSRKTRVTSSVARTMPPAPTRDPATLLLCFSTPELAHAPFPLLRAADAERPRDRSRVRSVRQHLPWRVRLWLRL